MSTATIMQAIKGYYQSGKGPRTAGRGRRSRRRDTSVGVRVILDTGGGGQKPPRLT